MRCALAFAAQCHVIGPFPTSSLPTVTTLRVATYNIHKGVTRSPLGLKHRVRIHDMRQQLQTLGADLICLQEVQGRHERHAQRFAHWPEQSQADYLALGADYHTAYGRAAVYLHGDHGNALLSRFPIVHTDHRDVSDHVLEKRGILHCGVDLGGTVVHVFVAHLGLFAGSRQRQADVLAEWIKRAVPDDAPLLIAGDFNDWRNLLTERLSTQLGVSEVFDDAHPDPIHDALDKVRARLHGFGMQPSSLDKTAQLLKRRRAARTYPSFMPLMHLDRIYQRGFAVRTARVLTGPGWSKLSDHAPLVAELELA